MGIEIRVEDNQRPDSQDYVMRVDGRQLFAAYKYPVKRYASTFWQPRENITTEEAVRQLDAFYNALRHGGFQGRGSDKKQIGISSIFVVQGHHVDMEASLGDTTDLDYSLVRRLEQVHIDRTLDLPRVQFLRFNTEYADFRLVQDKGGQPWSPQTGKIGVISHLDISGPLAHLVARTSAVAVPPERIRPVLRMIYTFE